jgi:alanyl-tRNA synthetase
VTDRLYYNDGYLTEFRARVIEASPDLRRVYLDRTAFYPTSGGQPFDIGTLGGVRVNEVVDEDTRVAHILDAPLPDTEVSGSIDWHRRFDHMQQHTGQHLLSAVLIELFDAPTVSFHLGTESSNIEVSGLLEPEEIRKAEQRANRIVYENRPVEVSFRDSSEDLGLRKPTDREGVVRIVSIHNLDRSACGGTHVRATGEIGSLLIRKQEKIRGNVRIEFLCGMRAVKRARADFEALSTIGRSFSAMLDDTPGLVAAQLEKLHESDRIRRRLSSELAQARGRELYGQTTAGPDGIRKIRQRVDSLSEDVRAEAQSFTAGEKSVFLALASNPPSVLLAASKDSGINAGQALKEALAKAGGRGGGSPTMAQGSLNSTEDFKLFE